MTSRTFSRQIPLLGAWADVCVVSLHTAKADGGPEGRIG